MVDIDFDSLTKQDCPKLLQSFDNGQQLPFGSCIIMLAVAEFARVEGNWFVALRDDRTNLVLRCISVDFKRLVEIWVVQ